MANGLVLAAQLCGGNYTDINSGIQIGFHEPVRILSILSSDDKGQRLVSRSHPNDDVAGPSVPESVDCCARGRLPLKAEIVHPLPSPFARIRNRATSLIQ